MVIEVTLGFGSPLIRPPISQTPTRRPVSAIDIGDPFRVNVVRPTETGNYGMSDIKGQFEMRIKVGSKALRWPSFSSFTGIHISSNRDTRERTETSEILGGIELTFEIG